MVARRIKNEPAIEQRASQPEKTSRKALPRVLVVGKSASPSLLEEEGLYILKAETVIQAMAVVEHERPDLVIVDRRLPEEGAKQLGMEIKLVPDTAKTPVIVVGAQKGKVIAGDMFAAVFSEPLDRAKFQQTVRTLLRRKVVRRIGARKERPLRISKGRPAE